MKLLHEKFIALDGIALIITLFFIFGTAFFAISPFAEMFTSMGKELPLITKLVLQPGVKLLSVGLPLGVLSMLFLPQILQSIVSIRLTIMGSFFLASLLQGIIVIGLYMPMFDMASGI